MSREEELPSLVRLPLAARAAVAVIGVALVWLAVLLAERAAPVDLTVVLLLLLVLVLAVAVLTGPVLGVLTAVAAVVLVNWYLVPPFRTFEIASTENLVALVVFGLLAALASLVVELSARIQAAAMRDRTQAALLGAVVAPAVDDAVPLDRLRESLELDRLTLLRESGGVPTVLRTSGTGAELPTTSARVLDVAVPGGYRLVGAGPARMAPDPRFVESLAAAAVRSYESDRMRDERRRADELSEVDAARTALLASVGHDLRTPLAGLRLAVDALQGPGALDPAATAELWRTVDDSTTRLDELISNLLDMSRLEAGVLVAQVEPVALDAVVAGALLGRPQAPVEVDVADDLPLVLADPVLLERVVENLVSNALRYAAPSPERPVVVRARLRDAAVELDVVDHGPGLGESATRDAALSPGGTADSSTGLGLAIVRGFAEPMGATLALLDTPGGGLTARVALPRAEQP